MVWQLGPIQPPFSGLISRSHRLGTVSVMAGALRAFLDILVGHCRGLPADVLTSLDRVIERKL